MICCQFDIRETVLTLVTMPTTTDTNFDRYNSHDEPMDDGRYPGRGSTQPLPSQIIAPPPPPLPSSVSEAAQSPRRNIPWTNPAAFPTDILNRFKCQADDINRVFRIDLTPVFTDKTTRLYQPEIDFFFRYTCVVWIDLMLAILTIFRFVQMLRVA